jgi:DNA-binding NarL/FixJ family response regulator
MQVILVGKMADRARLRAQLDEADIEIVGEFGTLSEAHSSLVHSGAVVLALEPGDVVRRTDRKSRGSGREQDGEWIEQPLTRREIEVLQLLAEGLPNKSIAQRLSISGQTVKFHVASICGKLGASNRTEAVHLALRRGLINL